MTDEKKCPTKITCPRAPVVKAIWQDTALHGKLIPEPNRYRLPTMLASRPGFYKLDVEDEHPHW